MKLLLSRRYAFALVALAVATSVGCCCTRKGLVLRGDWSLELNRVPHMRSNGPTYDADCSAPSCTSCTSGSCSCSDCLSSAGGQEFGAIDGAGGRCYVHGDRRIEGGAQGVYYGEEGEYGDAYAGGENYVQHDPAAPAFSRFHPVPTRPVFEPQPVAYHPAMGAPPPPQAERLPPPVGTSQRRSQAPNTARRPAPAAAAGAGAPQSGYVLVELEQPADDVRQVSHVEMVEGPSAAGDEPSQGVEAATSGPELSVPTSGKNSVTWKVARRRT